MPPDVTTPATAFNANLEAGKAAAVEVAPPVAAPEVAPPEAAPPSPKAVREAAKAAKPATAPAAAAVAPKPESVTVKVTSPGKPAVRLTDKTLAEMAAGKAILAQHQPRPVEG